MKDHDLRELLRHGGRNQLIDLAVEGETTPVSAMIRGVQRNPVSRQLVHVDFIRVSLTMAINASVSLVFVGESLGVKMFGGVLVRNMDSVQVRALPANMPQHVEVDVSVLAELDQTLHVRHLSARSDVEIVSDPDALVAKVEPPRLQVEGEGEEAPAAVVVVGEEAEEAAE